MATALKVMLALLNAVPAFIQLLREHHNKRRSDAKTQAIEDDTLGEWSNRFGQLRDDTYSDPAARCLCDTPVSGHKDDSPCMGRGDLSSKDGSGKTT